jgi:hypothetical protein
MIIYLLLNLCFRSSWIISMSVTKGWLNCRKKVNSIRARTGDMVGNLAMPPPPATYECPSSRRRAARESLRCTHHGKEFESEGVRKEYRGIEAAGSPLKPHVAGDLHHHNPEIDTSTGVFDRGRGEDQQPWEAMVTGKDMEGRIGGQTAVRG